MRPLDRIFRIHDRPNNPSLVPLLEISQFLPQLRRLLTLVVHQALGGQLVVIPRLDRRHHPRKLDNTFWSRKVDDRQSRWVPRGEGGEVTPCREQSWRGRDRSGPVPLFRSEPSTVITLVCDDPIQRHLEALRMERTILFNRPNKLPQPHDRNQILGFPMKFQPEMQNRRDSGFHPLLSHAPLEPHLAFAAQPLGSLLGIPEVQGICEVQAGSEESERRQDHRHELFVFDRASGGYHSDQSPQVRLLHVAVRVVFDVWSVDIIRVRSWAVGWEWSRMIDHCERVPER